MINIKNLFFAYDKTDVLEDINLTINEKDFLAIIGPNGGGKSTLLKLLLSLLIPKSGTIILEDNLTKSSLGYVPQNTNLNINFPITALEVVLMGHLAGKRPLFGYGKDEVTCALNSLTQVGMKEFADTKIGNLSGGQRQRVFIARALCSNPKVLLLDEPTASIDVKGQREIYDLLKHLNRTITIIVVSHDISVLLNYAKKVAHINKNIVFHTLDNIQSNIGKDEHICEVELLNSLGAISSCGCSHD